MKGFKAFTVHSVSGRYLKLVQLIRDISPELRPTLIVRITNNCISSHADETRNIKNRPAAL